MMDKRKEINRQASFSSWPQDSGICTLALARAGFFYSRDGDEVECFQCKTRISGWKEGDNAEEKHRQMAPQCPMVNDNCPDNVPIDFCVPARATNRITNLEGDDASSDPMTSVLYDAKSRAERSGIVFNRPAIDRTQPDFGKLQSEAVRRSTFYDWPRDAHADPDALARAGFFYTGTGDRVQCFLCKGAVNSWEPHDDPINEHRKHFPNCPFVCRLNSSNVNEDNHVVDRSGQSTVQQTTIDFQPTISRQLIPETIPVERAALTPEQMPSTKATDQSKLREVEAQMDTQAVLAVLDMGYSYDEVKAVIETRLSTTGDDFPNAESLVEALFRLDEEMTSMSTGATASSFASEDVNISVYGNISTAASTASRTYASLPPTDSAKDSAMSVQSKASASKDKKCTSLNLESATFATAPDADQSKTKAKKTDVKAWINLPMFRNILDMGLSHDAVKEVIETKLLTKGCDPNDDELLEAILPLLEVAEASDLASGIDNGNSAEDSLTEESTEDDGEEESND